MKYLSFFLWFFFLFFFLLFFLFLLNIHWPIYEKNLSVIHSFILSFTTHRWIYKICFFVFLFLSSFLSFNTKNLQNLSLFLSSFFFYSFILSFNIYRPVYKIRYLSSSNTFFFQYTQTNIWNADFFLSFFVFVYHSTYCSSFFPLFLYFFFSFNIYRSIHWIRIFYPSFFLHFFLPCLSLIYSCLSLIRSFSMHRPVYKNPWLYLFVSFFQYTLTNV